MSNSNAEFKTEFQPTQKAEINRFWHQFKNQMPIFLTGYNSEAAEKMQGNEKLFWSGQIPNYSSPYIYIRLY